MGRILIWMRSNETVIVNTEEDKLEMRCVTLHLKITVHDPNHVATEKRRKRC